MPTVTALFEAYQTLRPRAKLALRNRILGDLEKEPRRWLTLEETARLLGKSKSQVSRYVSMGELTTNGSKHYRIRFSSVVSRLLLEGKSALLALPSRPRIVISFVNRAEKDIPFRPADLTKQRTLEKLFERAVGRQRAQWMAEQREEAMARKFAAKERDPREYARSRLLRAVSIWRAAGTSASEAGPKALEKALQHLENVA